MATAIHFFGRWLFPHSENLIGGVTGFYELNDGGVGRECYDQFVN